MNDLKKFAATIADAIREVREAAAAAHASLSNVVVSGFEAQAKARADADAALILTQRAQEAHAEASNRALEAFAGRVGTVEATVDAARRSVDSMGSEWRAAIAELRAGIGEEIFNRVAAIPIPKGEPGRDGRMTPPVTYEAGVSYPHGATVRHAGGLWNAYRDTKAEPTGSAECGWTLLCNGIRSAALARGAHERELLLTLSLSDGDTHSMKLRVPSLIGRGVWQIDAGYDTGDVVSHAGSAWTAKRANEGRKPGTPEAVDDWTLTVKRGKDGISAPTPRGMRWRGMHELDAKYEPNDIVRTRRAVWICTKATDEPPSSKSAAWEIFFDGGDDAA